MPRYDYQCDTCGHRFEARQSFSEDPLTECPQCGSAIRRVIHPVGIVFKGSGFYITDSRNASSATKAAGSPAGEPKKETTPETKSTETGTGTASATPAASTPTAPSTPPGAS